mmetsp:Transcript_93942/g.265317  ORF Transcript_93942/g.265317 Transcript_93942/m.265317 type:complete len:340 (-) Transcript_93942:168-1187(-)
MAEMTESFDYQAFASPWFWELLLQKVEDVMSPGSRNDLVSCHERPCALGGAGGLGGRRPYDGNAFTAPLSVTAAARSASLGQLHACGSSGHGVGGAGREVITSAPMCVGSSESCPRFSTQAATLPRLTLPTPMLSSATSAPSLARNLGGPPPPPQRPSAPPAPAAVTLRPPAPAVGGAPPPPQVASDVRAALRGDFDLIGKGAATKRSRRGTTKNLPCVANDEEAPAPCFGAGLHLGPQRLAVLELPAGFKQRTQVRELLRKTGRAAAIHDTGFCKSESQKYAPSEASTEAPGSAACSLSASTLTSPRSSRASSRKTSKRSPSKDGTSAWSTVDTVLCL